MFRLKQPHLTLVALFVLSLLPSLVNGEDKKDSPLVASTRKKLDKVISIEFKDQPLKDVLSELGDEAEIRFYLGTGVPQHKGITFKATDKPLKVILDEMFKPNGFGYIVHRKEKDGDRYEGWVQVVQGDQRGYDKGEGSTAGKKPTRAEESSASRLLNKAKTLVRQKKNEEAKKALEELLEKYAHTKSAGEAEKMLEKLK